MFDYSEVVRLLQAINANLGIVMSDLKTVTSNSGTISSNSSHFLTALENLYTAITQFFGKFDWTVLYGALAVIVLCSIVNSFLKRGWLN